MLKSLPAIVLSTASCVFAQAQAAPSSQTPTTVLRTVTQLVVVDV